MSNGIIIASVVVGGVLGFLLFAFYCCFVVGSRSDGDDDED